jgi:hypothetical protein
MYISRKKKILESEIQKQILDYLKLKRVFHFKNNTAGIYKVSTGSYIPSQSVGAPDIICVIGGTFCGLEVKRPGGKQSDNQKAFQDSLEEAGGKYYLVFSLDDVIKII